MSYKLTAYGKKRLGLPGVPWRELSDEEFEAAVKRYPGIEEQGYFVKVEPEPEEALKPRRFGRQAAVEDAAQEEVSNDG